MKCSVVNKRQLGHSVHRLSIYHLSPLLPTLFAKVSWVRHRDIHILTAGAYTYTSDQRFQALHRQNTGHGNEWSDWTLCIKWAQERDQGIYECQISTIPIKSYQFHLNVVGKFHICIVKSNLTHRIACVLPFDEIPKNTSGARFSLSP